jgi:peptide chain release factor subunit 1
VKRQRQKVIFNLCKEEAPMLITKSRIHEILKYRFSEYPVTSLYLDVDPERNTKEEYTKKIKALLHEKKETIEKLDLSKEAKKSVFNDFERITAHIERIREHSFNGLAIFCSSGNDLLQVLQLDEPVDDLLVVDSVPYTRPLFSMLSHKKHAFALLFKKNKLRVFEIVGDEITEHIDLVTRTQFTSRENDYIFINEKKAQHREKTESTRFLHEASQEVLDLFMEKGADYIALSGDKNIAKEFAKHMHPYLAERFAGLIEVPFEAKKNEVLEAMQTLMAKKCFEENRELTQKIKAECSKDGEACDGIEDVLRAVSMAAVDTLVVEEGYAVPGFVDKENNIFYVKGGVKDTLTDSLVPVSDVINEAIEEVSHQGADVRIIEDETLMNELDHIAALLRFPISE